MFNQPDQLARLVNLLLLLLLHQGHVSVLLRASRRQTDLNLHSEKMMINVDHGFEETICSLEMGCTEKWVTHKSS